MKTEASFLMVGLISSLYTGKVLACPDPPCGPPPAPMERSAVTVQQPIALQLVPTYLYSYK